MFALSFAAARTPTRAQPGHYRADLAAQAARRVDSQFEVRISNHRSLLFHLHSRN
jgi:hypothetical protein